jgi:hypothetical protein
MKFTRRRRREEELEEEIQSHLRMAIRDRMERGGPADVSCSPPIADNDRVFRLLDSGATRDEARPDDRAAL